jgi:selenide, water dikinase
MACASKVTIEIDAGAVPLLEGALEMASTGMLTSGDKTNREYVGADVEITNSVDENIVKLLFDPQTAGGMLIAIREDKVEPLLATLGKNYPNAQIIGRVVPPGPHSIIVNDKQSS